MTIWSRAGSSKQMRGPLPPEGTSTLAEAYTLRFGHTTGATQV